MTAQQLITDHLDIWTAAHKTRSTAGRGSNNKLNLHGIKKLRELILELAVRGKLVPQDASDEPASELLKKIAAEKAKLIKEGKIKKEKPLPEITDEEKPFELPISWEWIHLAESGVASTGGTPKSADSHMFDGDIPFIGPGQISPNGKFLPAEKYLTEEGCQQSSVATAGDILMVCIGGSIGKSLIVEQKLTFNQQINCVSPIIISSRYLNSAMNSISFQCELLLKSTGSATPIINRSKWEELLIALPPLAEQHRIVAKVDELMAFCDQLEQTQSDNIAAHAQLVEALLAALTNSGDHFELQNNWQRIAAHFDTLFTTEHSIDQLKQTILQLAVMGKLVPQNPKDEPASELLEKIAAEKAQLIKEGKIKKEKPLPEITDEEKPFELPSGWEWARLANISDVGTGATPSRTDSSYYDPAEVNWVTSGETSEEYIRETKEKVSWKAVKETNVSIYPVGTLIVAMYGQGKTRGQVTELMIEAGTNQACAAIRLIEDAVHHRKYVKLFFIKAYDELREQSAGGAQPNLNVGKVSITIIPLPPLAEQHRIVTKVDELMSLCDTLKTNLQNAQTTQLALADALVERAVG